MLLTTPAEQVVLPNAMPHGRRPCLCVHLSQTPVVSQNAASLALEIDF